MRSEALAETLRSIDGRGYGAYRSLRGAHSFGDWTLFVDHVQADPFAAPSRARLRVARAVARIPAALDDGPVRRIALRDFLARAVRDALPPSASPHRRGGSGRLLIDAGGQEVLERTAAMVTDEWVEARIQIDLPASGRRVVGAQAEALLLEELPRVVAEGLIWNRLDQKAGEAIVASVEKQERLRRALVEHKLVAFVADGAILPRESGDSDAPMSAAVAFRAPRSLSVQLDAGDGTTVAGMGIPEGVTLIVGGGYHGKSTLLRALERSVYPHVPGDGREGVVTRHDAVKVRAEDGRPVSGLDIRPFIRSLPGARDIENFRTRDASGSTSQAAGILEAIEVGAKVLLMDEDTSATNFMVRDGRMQALVAAEQEPIAPFVDRVRELYDRLGVSTVLVLGGSGDYFEPADNIIKMVEFLPVDVTQEAKRVAAERPTGRRVESAPPFVLGTGRSLLVDGGGDRRPPKIRARDVSELLYGGDRIDLKALDQLVDPSQTRALGFALRFIESRFGSKPMSLNAMMNELDAWIDDAGLDALAGRAVSETHFGNLARPRRFEVAGALNRWRSARMEPRRSSRANGEKPC